MLSKEDLENFATIKTCLVECTVLSVNLGWDSITAEFNKMLSDAILVPQKENTEHTQEALEQITFLPETSFPEKIDFSTYF